MHVMSLIMAKLGKWEI